MVRIRMQRLGRPHRPFYRIAAIEKQVKRNGRVLENLGWYNPGEKDPAKQLLLHVERVKFWLANGASPSDTMMDILSKQNLVDAEAWAKVRAARVEAKKKAQEKAAAIAAAGGDKKKDEKKG